MSDGISILGPGEPDGNSTHLPVTICAALSTTGAIVEFGCGNYSTAILHEIARLEGRMLYSLDNSDDWLSQFRYLRVGFHEFLHVNKISEPYTPPVYDWEAVTNKVLELEGRIGMALIDHAPSTARAGTIAQIAGRVELIVVHDWNVGDYHHETIAHLFPYRFEYKCEVLHTAVLSKTRRFEMPLTEGKVR